MKQIFALIGAVVLIVSLIVFGFTFRQVRLQRELLNNQLQKSTALLADSLKESIRPSYVNNSTSTLQNLLDKITDTEELFGAAIFDQNAALVAKSSGLPEELTSDKSTVRKSISGTSAEENFSKYQDGKVYVFASPLRKDENTTGSLVLYKKADFVDSSLRQIWKSNILRLFLQIILVSMAVILVLRWIIYKPILKMAESIRHTRTGKGGAASDMISHSFFKPIAAEISKMAHSLVIARNAASEEARMRLEELDSPWTEERLKEFFKAYLKGRKIFVVSNREPYVHKKIKNEIRAIVPAGGVVTALESVMAACGGVWIAHGSGEADKMVVDKDDKIAVPPDDPKYTLKRVWLTDKEVKGHYVGFSNEALWPLCHLAHTRPIFRKEDWTEYRKVNGKFAQALLAEIKDVQRPVVLIQDYHFALLPEMIKNSRPDAEIGIFWHMPWPSAESFSICPWRKEVLEGMLGADVIGFHTQQYCNNFIDTVGKEIESLTDEEKFSVTHNGRTSYIKPFPISVAFTGDNTGVQEQKSKILEDLDLKTKYLGLGVDRLDYTKGILERLKGVEFFFDMYPAYKEQFTFVQISPLSRQDVEKYRDFNVQVTKEAERINEKLESNGWKPVILLKQHLSHEEINPLYRAADVCLVTSLSDGMNLVAKEFVAARNDESGVLVLSQFTGASRDLKGALIVNPYSAEEMAEAIHTAITMSPTDQHRRMKKLRETVKNYNIYRWAVEFLKAVTGMS